MNKVRVSMISFNLKIQHEWAFLVWTPGTLGRNFQKIYAVLKKHTRSF